MNRRLFLGVILPLLSFLPSCKLLKSNEESKIVDVLDTLLLQVSPFREFSKEAVKLYPTKESAEDYINNEINLNLKLREKDLLDRYTRIRDKELKEDKIQFLENQVNGDGYFFSKLEIACLRLHKETCS